MIAGSRTMFLLLFLLKKRCKDSFNQNIDAFYAF